MSSVTSIAPRILCSKPTLNDERGSPAAVPVGDSYRTVCLAHRRQSAGPALLRQESSLSTRALTNGALRLSYSREPRRQGIGRIRQVPTHHTQRTRPPERSAFL